MMWEAKLIEHTPAKMWLHKRFLHNTPVLWLISLHPTQKAWPSSLLSLSIITDIYGGTTGWPLNLLVALLRFFACGSDCISYLTHCMHEVHRTSCNKAHTAVVAHLHRRGHGRWHLTGPPCKHCNRWDVHETSRTSCAAPTENPAGVLCPACRTNAKQMKASDTQKSYEGLRILVSWTASSWYFLDSKIMSLW